MPENNIINNKIVDKIRKLLNLGNNNPNENEANSAILEAHRLMAKHGIDDVDLEGGPEKVTHTVVRCEHKGNKQFRKLLGLVIGKNFRCRCYNELNNQIAFFGRTDDAMIARDIFEFAYTFANREANRLYRQRRQDGYTGEGVVNSYAIGFIEGLKEKLEQQSTALMVVVPKDVQDAFEEMSTAQGFRTTKTRVKTSNLDRMAFSQGKSDGRIVLNGRRLGAAG